MKKYLALISALALVAMVVFTGCEKKKQPAPPAAQPAMTPPPAPVPAPAPTPAPAPEPAKPAKK